MSYDNTTPKTRYSFVPLPEKVFFPDWADQISQDIPFSDALSGSITFDIVAKTPVFVRNGQKAGGKDSSFSRMPDGTFFLPSTSIKGEIANVLRIMSFGKMGQVADASFGLRDLSNSRAGESYKQRLRSVRCGWLRQTANPASESGYELEDWGTPKRISTEHLAQFLYTGDPDLNALIHAKDYDYFNDSRCRNDERAMRKTALHKYLRAEFDKDIDPINDGMFIWTKKKEAKPGVVEVYWKDDEDGLPAPDLSKGRKGVIVFTGQPNRKKHHDFFFEKPERAITYFPSEYVIRAFFSMHASSMDFAGFRKKQLDKGFSIPVFFLVEGSSIHSLGLTALYKYPFKKSIHDAIPTEHMDKIMDLSECIFGAIKKESFKGRVQFSHAKALDNPIPMEEKAFRMSQPRASFYPFYVEGGKTWDNADKIAGRKRYPVRFDEHFLSTQDTKEMKSTAAMLPPGTTFKETVRFHNLRPVELGALLSAITFHGNQDQCFHSIGFGKPLGYGAVSIQNITLEGLDVKDNPIRGINEYMAAFENQMTAFTSNWLSSPQMSELILMAQGIPAGKEYGFAYMELKDFQNLKKEHKGLPPFSVRTGQTQFRVKSIKTKY